MPRGRPPGFGEGIPGFQFGLPAKRLLGLVSTSRIWRLGLGVGFADGAGCHGGGIIGSVMWDRRSGGGSQSISGIEVEDRSDFKDQGKTQFCDGAQLTSPALLATEDIGWLGETLGNAATANNGDCACSSARKFYVKAKMS